MRQDTDALALASSPLSTKTLNTSGAAQSCKNWRKEVVPHPLPVHGS